MSTVGRDLYEKFYRGYTRKQWGVEPSQLAKSVTARIPIRTNRDDRYFSDAFQKMPADGYTQMFERMVDHPRIEVALGVDYSEVKDRVRYRRMIFTGPVDEFFLGRLPYRSLHFRHETRDEEWHQAVAVVNYPQTESFTRVTEYKHLTGQRHPKTSLSYEYPSDVGDPYYPVPRPENQVLYKRYQALTQATPAVWFVGRLATYRYCNMDQVVGQALAAYGRIDAMLGPRTPAPHLARRNPARVQHPGEADDLAVAKVSAVCSSIGAKPPGGRRRGAFGLAGNSEVVYNSETLTADL